jgi:hypothetical protein
VCMRGTRCATLEATHTQWSSIGMIERELRSFGMIPHPGDMCAGVMEIALTIQQLHTVGYRAVSMEANPIEDCCIEYTFLRLRCPETEPL